MKINREWFLLFGSLIVVAALYNHYINPRHSVLLIEIILVAIGVILVLFSMKLSDKRRKIEETGILMVFFSRFISIERCKVIIPFVGFLLLLSWSIWKIFIVGATNLWMTDFIVTLLGLSLVLYPSSSSRFQKEKDFIVLYLIFLTIVFVVIWRIYSLTTGETYGPITAYSEYYFITIPVVAILQLFGIKVTAVINESSFGIKNIIEYEYGDRLLRVGIGTGCSGFYSVGLFFSAFLAFVLVRYRKVDRYIIFALILGFIMCWLSNIIRMAVTIWVGIAFGPPALATFHMYFGVVLFIIVNIMFWMLIVRWLDRVEQLPSIPREIETQKEEELIATVTSQSD